MKTLDELLRETAAKGELNYLSIACTEKGFEVAYRGVKRSDGSIRAHRDPVCAVMLALTGKPGEEPAPRARKQRARQAEPAAAPRDAFDDLLG